MIDGTSIASWETVEQCYTHRHLDWSVFLDEKSVTVSLHGCDMSRRKYQYMYVSREIASPQRHKTGRSAPEEPPAMVYRDEGPLQLRSECSQSVG